MATSTPTQLRFSAFAVSIGSLVIAALEFLDRPDPGEIVEMPPEWYAWFTIGLHGVILLFLLLFLAQIGRMTTDRPGLRLPMLATILVGIVAAAYVLALDLNMV